MQQAIQYLKGDSRKLLIFLALVSVGCIFLSALFGTVINVVIVCLLIIFVSIYIIYKSPVHGLTITLSIAFLLPLFLKMFKLYSIPITTLIELVNLLLFAILIIKGKFAGWKSLPGILMLIWAGLQFAEIFNPNAQSRVAGFLAMRATLMVVLGFFNSYSAIGSKEDVYTLFRGWLLLALSAALYGIYQEYFGLPSYDFEWATVDEFRYKLLFTWGRLRKFSFFTSASEFGLVMVYSGLGVLVLGLRPALNFRKRIWFIVLAALMFAAMMFSGSRTAMVLMVAGGAFLTALTLWRRALLMIACIGFVSLLFVFKPTSNKALRVMLTAFEGTEDASMNVRLLNQSLIRGYIRDAPLGFGIGSTGYYGAKYSPNSFIGTFPPDSELVKIAIETGWIGLLFWCVILMLIFTYGINAYFRARDSEIKALMAVPLVVFFAMIIGLYPQECFRAPVLGTLFSFMIGLITKLKSLDERSVTH